jgi:predicted ATPase
MITRLEVDGFKSLRDFAVDLEPFTVLIGPNSAGKSNVLDALALLARLATMPVAAAFKHGRGKTIDQFSRHGAEVVGAIRFAVELLVYGRYGSVSTFDTFQSRVRYELSIERNILGSGAEKLVIRNESLRAMRREDDSWIEAHPKFAAHAGYVAAGNECLITNGVPDLTDDLARSTRLPGGSWKHIGGLYVRNSFRDLRMMDPGVTHLGEPSERIGADKLAPDASNLPTVLAELPDNVLGEIRADLVSLVPGIASFDVTPEGDEIRLDFELTGGERMPARLVSAGTLRILALLTALRMEHPSMLCVEEPENGIYPGRLRALLDLLGEATTRREANQLPTQVLLTTHSPVALAALRGHPEHLRFVDMVRRNGQRVTRVRTVGKPAAGEQGRSTISPREIDALLQAVQSEEPA